MSNAEKLVEVINRVDRLREICPRSLLRRGLKLAEEAGEVCRAIDIETDGPCTKYREREVDLVLEECADVFIVAMSIVGHSRGESFESYADKFVDMLHKKLGKWEQILTSEAYIEASNNDSNSRRV